MTQIALVEAFSDLLDTRCSSGKRHQQALCLAVFTMAVVAGNKGFLAIGDWIKIYRADGSGTISTLQRKNPVIQHNSTDIDTNRVRVLFGVSIPLFWC